MATSPSKVLEVPSAKSTPIKSPAMKRVRVEKATPEPRRAIVEEIPTSQQEVAEMEVDQRGSTETWV